MQGEVLDVATQLAWDEARAQVLWTTTQPLDRPAAVRPERDSTLDRGRAELGEERLVGLGRIGIIVLRARNPAAALQVAQDATVQDGCELDDVLIGQRRCFVKDRASQRIGARVDAVQDEDMEMQIEIERAAEALGHDDRATAARCARPLWPRVRSHGQQRAHEDAPDGGTELGVEGQQIADAEGEREHPLADRHVRQHVVDQVRGCVGHAPAATGRTETAALAGP